jgi:hypothetical protein
LYTTSSCWLGQAETLETCLAIEYRRDVSDSVIHHAPPPENILDHGPDIWQIWRTLKCGHPVTRHPIQLLVCFRDRTRKCNQSQDHAVELYLVPLCQYDQFLEWGSEFLPIPASSFVLATYAPCTSDIPAWVVDFKLLNDALSTSPCLHLLLERVP